MTNIVLSILPVDPGWAQVYVNISLAILTFLTLIVLCVYAWDTRRIANISIKQFNSSQTPFLALIRDTSNNNYSAWVIENQGNSAALNICVHYDCICPMYETMRKDSEIERIPLSLCPIPPGKNVTLFQPSMFESLSKCKIEYSSLDERHFITDVEIKNGNLISKFVRL
jgi:hypothetical protein